MYLYKRDHAGNGRTVICTVFSCEVQVVLKTTPPQLSLNNVMLDMHLIERHSTGLASSTSQSAVRKLFQEQSYVGHGL